MEKKIVISALLVLFLGVMVQAKDHTKFIRGHGGVIATGEQIEKGKVYGTFRIDGLFKTYKHLYAVVGFQDILTGETIKGENYDAGLCFYTRNPNSPKPQLYLMAGNGGTHINGGDKFVEYTYGGGIGILIPWSALDVTLMGQLKVMQIKNDRIFHISFGVQSGIDL